MNRRKLFELLQCHSTPGDEGEVRDWLTADFETAGWTVERHGKYAVSAVWPTANADAPKVLVCAHMDSPGYSVSALQDGMLTCVRLGSPRFPGRQAEVLLKTGKRRLPLTLRQDKDADREAAFTVKTRARAKPGDRLCFRAQPQVVCDAYVLSPFLDNRIGCFVLSELAHRRALRQPLPVQLILGATTSEEMGGFGAPVLAAATRPDLVICLDATYADEAQEVLLGGGPVLTLSDASVILSPAERERLSRTFRRAGVPLQTEVYNYSGTDSRAFPHLGLPCPVLALLIATEGNHSPVERAALADIDALLTILTQWATGGSDLGLG